MAKKKPVPLKNEKILSIEDVYAKLQAIEDAVMSMNRESDESLGNRIDRSNQGRAIDTEQFGKLVATAMGDYLKAHQDKIVVKRENSTGKEIEDVLEKYKAALLQLQKERPTSQGGNSHTQPSPIHEGLVVSSGITKPEKPTEGKTCSVIGSIVFPGTKYGRYLHPVISDGGYAPSYFASGSPLSSSRSLLHMTMPNYALFRRSMCCCVNLLGPINNGLKRQIISSIYIPTRKSIRKTLKCCGNSGTSD